ncbi:MAG TPA: UbiA family prenyltransferase, partial [Euzebya sp.]|nr:UbiA family prenyltransferase [Euzebya sp.]
LCAVASLALGTAAAVAHLIAVAGGWVYNAWAKTTPASIVPYVLSFGLLPVVVAAVAGQPPPEGSAVTADVSAGLLGAPWWAVVTAACFGAGVHLANALPDLEVDARTGVRGLPQRLGARGSAVGTVLLLGLGAATVLFGPSGALLDVVTLGGAAVVTLLLAAIAWLGLRRHPEAAFKVAMLTGLVVVGLLVARGDALA